MVQTDFLTNAPQRGSPVDTVGRGLKWLFWIILIVVILVIIYFASILVEYGATLDPSTWDDAAVAYFEDKTGITDTGQGAGSALLSAIYWGSIFGVGGGLLGLGTSSSGFSGAGQALGKSGSSWYTFLKRIFGG
tara:strand:- start:2988 stop:3389 length:402 start_codon:yes stop_codon:yes gene_type:complete